MQKAVCDPRMMDRKRLFWALFVSGSALTLPEGFERAGKEGVSARGLHDTAPDAPAPGDKPLKWSFLRPGGTAPRWGG